MSSNAQNWHLRIFYATVTHAKYISNSMERSYFRIFALPSYNVIDRRLFQSSQCRKFIYPELFTEQYLNYNCTMNLKIDPCSYNITQLTCQKGIKSLWQSSKQLLGCQGSLIVAIPTVHSAYRYLKMSHRIHSYKGSCYTA